MVDTTTRLAFWTARHRPDLPHPAPISPAFVRSNRYDLHCPTIYDDRYPIIVDDLDLGEHPPLDTIDIPGLDTIHITDNLIQDSHPPP